MDVLLKHPPLRGSTTLRRLGDGWHHIKLDTSGDDAVSYRHWVFYTIALVSSRRVIANCFYKQKDHLLALRYLFWSIMVHKVVDACLPSRERAPVHHWPDTTPCTWLYNTTNPNATANSDAVLKNLLNVFVACIHVSQSGHECCHERSFIADQNAGKRIHSHHQCHKDNSFPGAS